ncbi:hypothetical protein BSKO_12897 [Bryopsis sp. KO-2023]|nr:hypothetical protein BSKO_12897 [Bryopsis sp. KO-2023]
MSGKVFGVSKGFLVKGSVLLGFSYFAGQWIMHGTNPETKTMVNQEDELTKMLRGKETVEQKMLQKANKERLQVLFDEIKNKKDDQRYTAALDGVSLGTHTAGTSKDAVAIKKTD